MLKVAARRSLASSAFEAFEMDYGSDSLFQTDGGRGIVWFDES